MSNFAKPRVIKLSLRKENASLFSQNSLVKSHTTFDFSQQAACLGEVEGVQGKVNSHFFSKQLSIFDDDDNKFSPFYVQISHELFSH